MVTAQADFLPDFGGYRFYMWKDARFVAFWVYQLPSGSRADIDGTRRKEGYTSSRSRRILWGGTYVKFITSVSASLLI